MHRTRRSPLVRVTDRGRPASNFALLHNSNRHTGFILVTRIPGVRYAYHHSSISQPPPERSQRGDICLSSLCLYLLDRPCRACRGPQSRQRFPHVGNDDPNRGLAWRLCCEPPEEQHSQPNKDDSNEPAANGYRAKSQFSIKFGTVQNQAHSKHGSHFNHAIDDGRRFL